MEKFFWADQIADRIIKEKKSKKVYVCASGITPSGTVHIGNFREVITTDLVAKALKNKGKKVKFIYSWDDYDRFRKIPENIPKEKRKKYSEYIGVSVSDVPSPFGKGSYAGYFEKEFESSLKKVGISPKFIRQSVMNKKCRYSKLIKKALDKRKEIIKILDKYRKEPLEKNWLPIIVYCEKCKKDLTKILGIKGYEIEYSCECNFHGKFDYRKKGLVKLKWRVDWPARWSYEKVDFEPGGIDHSAYGSSYDTGKEIVKLYNYAAPIYTFYEWVKIKGGGAFSSSSGNATSLDDVHEIYEPEVLRYLFVGTRPNKSFDISFDNDVIKIYDDFDELERKYYEKEANEQEKRIYELSSIKISKEKPLRMSFRHLITLVQTGKTKGLKKEQKIRAEKVKNWIDKYAGEDFKFEVKDKIEIELSDKEKQAMIMLKEILSTKNYNEIELFDAFNEICGAVGISPKEFFQVAYSVILGKTRGPRLASLINEIGKEKIIKLLNQIK